MPERRPLLPMAVRSKADEALAREADLAVAAVRAKLRKGGPRLAARLAAIHQREQYAEGSES